MGEMWASRKTELPPRLTASPVGRGWGGRDSADTNFKIIQKLVEAKRTPHPRPTGDAVSLGGSGHPNERY